MNPVSMFGLLNNQLGKVEYFLTTPHELAGETHISFLPFYFTENLIVLQSLFLALKKSFLTREEQPF